MISTGGILTQPTQAAPAVWGTYQDPRFNNGAGSAETIRRALNYISGNEHYARNGYWSPDNRYFMRGNATGNGWVMDMTTGADVRALGGVYGSDIGFDPTNSDRIYYYNLAAGTLRQILVSTGADTLVKSFGAALEQLTSVDQWDASGRYFVVRYGGITRIWDKVEDVVYTGGPTRGGGGGWAGITPSGNHLVIADGQIWACTLNHATNTIGAIRNIINAHDHADITSASDGNDYVVCVGFAHPNDIVKVNLATPVETALFPYDSSVDEQHVSCAGDWGWVSIETNGPAGGGGHPYKNEIVRANVVTGAVERYAHHRSFSDADYYAQPRVCASWDGTRIAWSSDGAGFTGTGIGMYVLELSAGGIPPAAPTNLRLVA